jgi:mRNA interferase MazF
MIDRDSEKPPRIHPRLKAAPKIRQLLWCDFPRDAQLPEMWKTRPVVVVSFRNTLHGIATVVPCTTLPQPENDWAVWVSVSFTGGGCWALANYPSTIAVSRLSPDKGGVLRVQRPEFDRLLERLRQWLPGPDLDKSDIHD